MLVCIITTCKGRLAHLLKTAPTMERQKWYPLEIIVVDYGDPDNCFEVFRNNSLFTCVRVLDMVSVFSPSRARNIGANVANGNMLAFVDCDVLLHETWIAKSMMHVTGYPYASLLTQDNDQKETTGTCIISSEAFHMLRGYDEMLTDWGYQDHDLYNRAKAAGLTHHAFPGSLLEAIHNTDEERSKFYADRRVNYTGDRNRRICKQRLDPKVNPSGYGMGDCEIIIDGKPHQKLVVKQP